ncbi:hypothetical protein ES705_31402 [subsurface metagenome]|jgi:hypothetical protein
MVLKKEILSELSCPTINLSFITLDSLDPGINTKNEHESIIMLINAAIVNEVGFPGSITCDQIVIATKFAINTKI